MGEDKFQSGDLVTTPLQGETQGTTTNFPSENLSSGVIKEV